MAILNDLLRDKGYYERYVRNYQEDLNERRGNGDDTERIERTLADFQRKLDMTNEKIRHLEQEIEHGKDRPQSMPRTEAGRKAFWEKFKKKW